MKIYLLAVWLYVSLVACNQSASSKKRVPIPDTVYTYATPSRDGIGKYYYGREIAQVMGAGGAAWLERADREKEEGIAKVLEALPITDSSSVADIGAGTGYYSFRIARKVSLGRVYSVEIQDEMLAYLHKTIAAGGYKNVTVIKGTEQNANLPHGSIDLAIMVDVYHELAYPHEMLQNLRRALKPNGQLLLIEYKGEDPSIPIKELHKMTIRQAQKEMAANGFRSVPQKVSLPIQHFLLFKKE